MAEANLTEFVNSDLTLASLGEKEVIRRIIVPLFNPTKAPWSVGDDCALIEPAEGRALILSTDRVPADLIAFKLGILDHRGLGRYLVRLNLSDIAASGGRPCGLLLNLGLPSDMFIRDLIALLLGALDAAEEHRCGILGGDLSDSRDLSISATAIGQVERSRALSRQTAKAGDWVFVSRPLGLTPAAFHYYRHRHLFESRISKSDERLLNGQFLDIGPMFCLSSNLVASKRCSSCMDNTDGVGQSLSELAESSGVAILVDFSKLRFPQIVRKLAEISSRDATELAFSAGADFSLVGTINCDEAREPLQEVGLIGGIVIIGRVEAGNGVHLDSPAGIQPLRFHGWNYYASQTAKIKSVEA